MKRFLLASLLSLTVQGLALAQDTVRFTDLVAQLTDLERLAVLPSPGETCAQWSSWDRTSQYDAATGKYVAWDANGDGTGFIRKEGEKMVLAEMNGPGCIRRIWSARPESGHVYIYLDGATEPTVDLAFQDYFSGKAAPFDRPALCYEASKGWNNFVPIPYQKSCKIVADTGWGMYFHFTYSTFPEGTQVETFKRTLTPGQNAALDKANMTLSHPGNREMDLKSLNIVAAPGVETKVATLEGPSAITGLRVHLDLPKSPDDRAILRELALRITWDGETQPSVWAPLGDFFGTAPGANAYSSLPLGLGKDGWWYSYWYMPYKSATITLENAGTESRNVQFTVESSPLSVPIEKLGRFHAKWHRDAFLPSEPERAIDWTLLQTQGRGRFCGVMLHVWNPRGGWWGEGDEKFFVDGEKFPSTFGTGSEDYFGYAWCNPDLFTRAFHNQTICENNKGHVSVNRWQIVDNIPFQQSFEGAIEKYFPNSSSARYASTVYWYLAPGGTDPYGSVPMDQRMDWPKPAVTHLPGAIEAEDMKVVKKSGGNVSGQPMFGFQGTWSGDTQMWWIDAKPGDTLEVALPVETAGKYKLLTQLAKAPDYGIVQFRLDGEKLGEPYDLYHPTVVGTGEIELGVLELKAGEHRLTMEITGANPVAVKNYMVGVDYFKLAR